MTLVSCLLSKTSSALAHKRIFSGVNVEVIAEIARRWETSRTLAALVRLFLEVNHLVVVEIGACSEGLPTKSAFEWLFS